MKLLVTSDWQLAWSNLDTWESLVGYMLRVCKKYSVKYVLHLGDVKHTYNPVDVRVVNFAVNTIKQFKDAGIEFYAQLGNHDKIGMSSQSGDWGPSLEAAGAHVIARPETFTIGKHTFYSVPYSNDISYLKRAFRSVPENASVLLFHNELDKCKLNPYSRGDFDLKTKDLRPGKYRICLGGHIHLYQRIDPNVYYVGSPFCHDWGEANQRKYIILLDTSDWSLIKEPSPIPGYFDPSVPGFYTPKTWQGTHVRIQVPITPGDDAPKKLSNAKHKAEIKYAGANLVVLPKYDTDSESPVKIDINASDDEIVRAYIEQTCPDYISKDTAASFISHLLSGFNITRSARQRVEFLSGSASNFLCFKKLRIRFQDRKIVVITGKNEDWPNRKNGSGKTSYLQFPAVSLFGKTLKGQENDRWARNRCKDAALLKFRARLANGKIIKIIRQRRPQKLRLLVNGKDYSTGIGRRGTQKAIEQITGLTWETLANAVYVDQAHVSKILTGTDGERKAIFSKLLDLSRFEDVRKSLSNKLSTSKQTVKDLESDIAFIRGSIEHTEELLSHLPKAIDVAKLKRKIGKLKDERHKCHVEAQRLIPVIEVLAKKLKVLEAKEDLLVSKVAVATHEVSIVQHDISDIKSLGPVCNECKQPIDATHKQRELGKLHTKLTVFNHHCAKVRHRMLAARTKVEKLSSKGSEYRDQGSECVNRKALISSDIEKLVSDLKHAREIEKVRQAHEYEIAVATRKLAALLKYVEYSKVEMKFLEYCTQAMSKKGLPAHLAYQLCPRLNQAASYYSEVFSESEIQVSFQMDGEDINATVINVHGGETIADQSGGETRIAGLITSFAVAEVINPCNVLILDEPSESLDDYNARVFAEGLKKVSQRIGTIFITTHNPYVLAELESEETVNVVKRNGVSVIRRS